MDEFDICGCGSCADCCPPYGGEGLCGWSGSKDDDDDKETEMSDEDWEEMKMDPLAWEREENEKIDKVAREEFIRDNGREPTEEELAIKGNEIWYRWWVV